MKRYLRTAFIVPIILLSGHFASGQVKFTTIVNSRDIGQRDFLQVQFVVENAQQIEQLDPPADFPGFSIVQGPFQNSGMSVINGNMSQYQGVSFVLQPSHTGKFSIAGATALIDGQKMHSNSVTVNVHPGGGGAPAPAAGSPFGNFPANPMVQPFGADPFGPASAPPVNREEVLRPGENVNDKIRKNLFVKVQVDRNTCYVGEPIVAAYKLYSRVNEEPRLTKRPSLNGFSVYDMIDPGADAVSVEKLNGKNFYVNTIRKAQLIPLQAGTVNLDPLEVQSTVHFVKVASHQPGHRSGNRLQDMLDQLSEEGNFGPEVDENVTLDTKPLAITVKPLPDAGKPADFNGAVGNFSVEASLDKRNVAAQDEATLHVVVRGKGNLPVITAPVVDWPAGIDAYDPKAKESVNKTVVPMSGSKSFDYVFTARDSGHYTIPAINFSYFDPISATYKSANSQPLELQVIPAAKRSRPLAPEVATAPDEDEGVVRVVMPILLALLLGLGLGWAWWSSRRKQQRKVAKKEAAPGPKPEPQIGTPLPSAVYVPAAPAPDPLLGARRYFEFADYGAFCREVNRAIWKAIGQKLNLPSSELSKQNVMAQLELRGWDTPSILSLETALNECELNLYTPAYDRHNMEQLLRQAEWVLDRLA
ncbi:MAG TPA: BatD family protein [Puia sp.]|nr:BatD family protein [Puia sp.]